jgi:intracellular multiplication protein IcmK
MRWAEFPKAKLTAVAGLAALAAFVSTPLLSKVVLAQEATAPAASDDEFANEFDANRAAMDAGATPDASTNVESSATPDITMSAETPPEMPAAVAPETSTAATQDAPADEVITPENTPGGTTATAPAAPSGIAAPQTVSDPLAAYRAAQAQAEAAGTQMMPGAVDPLGMAGQLPIAGGVTPQSQEELQAQLEADALVQKEKMKQQAFDQALESLMPLSPDQTREMLNTFKDSREAAETPIATPTARTTVETVPLDPSETPLTIKTSPGFVTTLTILDMTGAPWAIQDISWAGKFEVTTPEEGGHVVRITPMSAHGAGNISIRLVDLITPITFSLGTGLEEVDYRFDARIPKQGPLAKTPIMEYGGLKAVAGADENLMRVLDGTGVSDATRLKMDGVDGATKAWRIADRIYLRTPLTLLSPSWDSSATSADGMNVYTLQASPVILLSDRGRMVKARVVPEE